MRRLTLLTIALLTATSARADFIHVVATGTFNNASGATELLPFLGGEWALDFTYRDDVTDSVSANPATGAYVGAIQSLQLDAGGNSFQLLPYNVMLVFDNNGAGAGAPGVTDLWVASTSEFAPGGSGGANYDQIELVLANIDPVDDFAAPFGSDALVPPPWPFGWDIAAISYNVRGPDGSQLASAVATISSLDVQVTTVPVPATAGLLMTAFGLPLCFGAGRRR